MSIYKASDLRRLSNAKKGTRLAKSILSESVTFSSSTYYDIFLSHSFNDADIIHGLKIDIESLGYKVYVDWIDDSDLNRKYVSKKTAQIIKERMKNCKCLFFAVSDNSFKSVWMPWELGYMDALKNRVAICPISMRDENTSSYSGQEYLSLYPYVDKAGLQTNPSDIKLWIHDDSLTYVLFDEWLKGTNPRQRS